MFYGSKKITIRKVFRRDFANLSKYLSKKALPRYSPNQYIRRFNFWWLKNPAFRKNDIYGWIILDNHKNKIKGFLGNIPADYKINGKIYNTASASTWVVDSDYRKYSIYLYFSYLKQKKDLFLNSTPANITSHIFMKTNFIDIAKTQNNYISFVSYRPIYYFLKKFIKPNNFNIIISKLIFFLYSNLFRVGFNYKRGDIKYKIIRNSIEIEKLLAKKKNILMNFEWVLNSDANKIFLKILNQHKLDNFIYMQYVDNPINKLKYIQILETNITSLNLIKNIAFEVAIKKKYVLDCIILCNSNMNKIFYGSFVKFNFLSKPRCFVKSDKINIKNILPNGTFGEKGFVIWN